MAPSNELNDPNTDILIEGTVLNKQCRPITNAVVDIWYAGGNPSKWLFSAKGQIISECPFLPPKKIDNFCPSP